MDWDKRYVEGSTPWEKGEAHPELLRLLQIGELSFPAGKQVVVPGCGLGHDVHALRDYGVKVLGIDISPHAVAAANSLFVEEGDFLKEDMDADGGVWEHTCFCALDPSQREDYVKAVARMIPSGEFLSGIFFLNPDMDEGEQGPPFGSSVSELKVYFQDDFEWVDDHVPELTYEGREGRELFVRMRRNK